MTRICRTPSGKAEIKWNARSIPRAALAAGDLAEERPAPTDSCFPDLYVLDFVILCSSKRLCEPEAHTSRLDGFAVVAACGFEQGEQIGHAEEVAYGLIGVDEFDAAAARASGDVEADDSAEAGTVHLRNFLEVKHDPLVTRDAIADRVFQRGGVLAGEPAEALNKQHVRGFVELKMKTV